MSLKPCAEIVVPKPLRRFITPIGFEDKVIKLKCCSVFDQAFFEKACDQAVFSKGLREVKFHDRLYGRCTDNCSFCPTASKGFDDKIYDRRISSDVTLFYFRYASLDASWYPGK